MATGSRFNDGSSAVIARRKQQQAETAPLVDFCPERHVSSYCTLAFAREGLTWGPLGVVIRTIRALHVESIARRRY